jgi:hypothetical protein
MVRTSLRSEQLQQLQAKVRACTSAYMMSLLADDEEGKDDSDDGGDDYRDVVYLNKFDITIELTTL